MPNRRRRRPPLSDPPSDPPFDPPPSDPPLSDPPLSDPPFARPLPQDVKDTGHRYTITQRIHCLSLLAEECFTATHIEAKTGAKERS
jgi:hypothetical protein